MTEIYVFKYHGFDLNTGLFHLLTRIGSTSWYNLVQLKRTQKLKNVGKSLHIHRYYKEMIKVTSRIYNVYCSSLMLLNFEMFKRSLTSVAKSSVNADEFR